MARRKVRVDVLAEDKECERFCSEVLQRLGIAMREIRMTTFQGNRSAKQWVDQQYPRFVRELRRRNYQGSLILLVATDADELTVARRKSRLGEALAANGLDPRTAVDRIVVWIPRWHIETWHLHFNSHSVDETTRYKAMFEKHIGKSERLKTHSNFVTEYRAFRLDPAAVAESPLPSIIEAHRESAAIPL